MVTRSDGATPGTAEQLRQRPRVVRRFRGDPTGSGAGSTELQGGRNVSLDRMTSFQSRTHRSASTSPTPVAGNGNPFTRLMWVNSGTPGCIYSHPNNRTLT